MCHDPNILVNWTQAQFPSKNSNSCSPLGEHCHNQGYLCWLAMMSLKCCGAPLPDAFQGKAALWRSSCYDSALSVCFYSKTSDLALTKATVPHWDETGTAFFFLKNVFECSLFLFFILFFLFMKECCTTQLFFITCKRKNRWQSHHGLLLQPSWPRCFSPLTRGQPTITRC